MWSIQTPDGFERILKKRLGPEEINRYRKAILELSNSDDPGKIGRPKKGPWSGYHVYGLGRSHRLIYKVLYKEKIVMIVAVGDHKQVYGKD